MRTVLYPPTIDWSFMFQRPQQIMRQFSKNGWKVIYCNITQNKEKPMLENVEDNIYVCNDWNAFIKSKEHVDVLYSTWAKCYGYVGVIKPDIVVYDRVDDFEEWEPYEADMLEKADIVFTSSKVLYNKTVGKHENVTLVRNACDAEHFNPERIGKMYFKVPKPVVCFIGALGKWVDADILREVADKFSLVVVGPQFGINSPPRAYYIGMVGYQELPRYYAGIDIGIIPFTDGRVSQAANPIKMYEYLAMGKPVVATSLPETEHCSKYLRTVKKGESFVSAIIEELRDDSKEKALKRREFAESNTWGHRFRVIEDAINKLEGK